MLFRATQYIHSHRGELKNKKKALLFLYIYFSLHGVSSALNYRQRLGVQYAQISPLRTKPTKTNVDSHLV